MSNFSIVEFFEEKKVRYISTTDDFFDKVSLDKEKYWSDGLHFIQILKTDPTCKQRELERAIRASSILWEANARGYCSVNWDKLASLPVKSIYTLLGNYYKFINQKWPHIVKQWDAEIEKIDKEREFNK